jgi:hypothetical protein
MPLADPWLTTSVGPVLAGLQGYGAGSVGSGFESPQLHFRDTEVTVT